MPIQAISELRLPRHNKMNPIGQPMMKRKIQLLNAQMWLVALANLTMLSGSLHAQTLTLTPRRAEKLAMIPC